MVEETCVKCSQKFEAGPLAIPSNQWKENTCRKCRDRANEIRCPECGIVASRFSDSAIRIISLENSTGKDLCQCRACKTVFLSESW